MSRISEVTFDRPPSLGFVDPGVLAELGQKFPATLGEAYTYDKNPKLLASDEFLEIVDPVTQALSRYVLDKHRVLPRQIHYSYSTNPVQPHKSQRGFDKWHIDGAPVDQEILLVSSALTTDVLVGRGRWIGAKLAHGLLRSSLRPAIFDQEIIGSAISAGLIEAHNPAPYEMVVTSNNLHKPAVNNTNRVIPRVFLRAITSTAGW